MRACATVQQLPCHGSYRELILVLREHRAGCCFRSPSCPYVEPVTLLPARCPTCSPKKFVQVHAIHDAVAAVVLHKHCPIVCVGVGLIQFVYGSHSRMAADLPLDTNRFSQPFSRAFRFCACTHTPAHSYKKLENCTLPHKRGTSVSSSSSFKNNLPHQQQVKLEKITWMTHTSISPSVKNNPHHQHWQP